MNEFAQMMKAKQQAEKEQRTSTHAFTAIVDEDLEENKSQQIMKLLGLEKPVVEKNVSKSIYFSQKALKNLDKATKEAGYPNRSKFLNALLERMYGDS